MTPLMWLVLEIGGMTPFAVHTGCTVGLYLAHRINARSPLREIPGAFSWYHWVREKLHWTSLPGGLASVIGQAGYQHAVSTGGWSTEEWWQTATVVVVWLVVRRWRDNHDCTCDDSDRRKRRRPTVASRIAAVAGRLKVVNV